MIYESSKWVLFSEPYVAGSFNRDDSFARLRHIYHIATEKIIVSLCLYRFCTFTEDEQSRGVLWLPLKALLQREANWAASKAAQQQTGSHESLCIS